MCSFNRTGVTNYSNQGWMSIERFKNRQLRIIFLWPTRISVKIYPCFFSYSKLHLRSNQGIISAFVENIVNPRGYLKDLYGLRRHLKLFLSHIESQI
jgi:hypothetical protein